MGSAFLDFSQVSIGSASILFSMHPHGISLGKHEITYLKRFYSWRKGIFYEKDPWWRALLQSPTLGLVATSIFVMFSRFWELSNVLNLFILIVFAFSYTNSLVVYKFKLNFGYQWFLFHDLFLYLVLVWSLCLFSNF